jgi:2-polyprenyl-3-methyl-5-hydroxy-6-metoxy-1,4-benzoquinol methylase
MELDQQRLEAFMHQFAGDFAAAMHAATVVVGDKLGLYAALAQIGPTDAASLAAATACDPRLVEEWLRAQYVSGYCQHIPDTGQFWLTPEQTAVLADPSTGAFLVGAMTIAAALAKDEEMVRQAFTSGAGLGWHEHHHDLFHGTERLFKAGYAANLTSAWIPALDGVDAKLRRGGTIADVGCGHGASTILLAQAYPDTTISGFDYHQPSVDVARKRATEAGVADRVHFDVATAQDFPGERYDLVCVLDAFHDMGDPPAAARHIRHNLDTDGTWLLVEPMAGDSLESNVNPVGRIFYAGSTLICTPGAQAQHGDYALGNQVPDTHLAELITSAGFSQFRRATETPFNRVFEARP